MNFKNLKNDFKSKGYFKILNFFDKHTIKNLNDEIKVIAKEKPKNIFFYQDRNNLIRRMEHFYNHTQLLDNINNKIQITLKNIFDKKFFLFKDKYNFKPPKGEGFFPHYDGIFNWKDKNGKWRKGWHEYADEFVNVLILLDDFNNENGPLEISKIHDKSFNELIKNTKQNGTPDLKRDLANICQFEKMICPSGSIVIFSSKCPHQSSKNNSDKDRGSLYYTYNPAIYGNNYTNYFEEKLSSQNKQSKSLSGEIN